MALNSFVTRDGLEMGRAQVVQAQAAGVEPDVRMNPILLKPSSDVGSQVIVNGEVRGDMPAKEYFRRKKSLIPDILRAYDSLADEFDIIVIEEMCIRDSLCSVDAPLFHHIISAYCNMGSMAMP